MQKSSSFTVCASFHVYLNHSISQFGMFICCHYILITAYTKQLTLYQRNIQLLSLCVVTCCDAVFSCSDDMMEALYKSASCS